MKTKSSIVETTNPNTVTGRFRTACASVRPRCSERFRSSRGARLLPLLLFLLLPAASQAQDYTYTTNSGAITITGYTGSGGDVTIPNTINGLPVIRIGQDAIVGCTSLTSVTIGTNVTSIGSSAFWYCTSLTNATIPASVTNIAVYVFGGCSSLIAIAVDPSNSAYSSVAGVLFNKSQTTLIECPGGEAGSYTISNGVTSIGQGAFFGCTSLTSVTIPNSVTNLGVQAFMECTSLTSAAIGNGVTSIEQEAFRDCTSLTGVRFWGNAPGDGSDTSVFSGNTNATVYYLSGTTGWGATFDGRPTGLWTGLTVSKLNAKVNFAKSNQDSCSLTATLDLGANFLPNGQTLTLSVGDGQVTYSLNKTGAGVYGKSTCRLTHARGASQWKLVATWKSGSWQASWASYGLINDTIKKHGNEVTLPVLVDVAGEEFAGNSPTLHYTAKQDKSGTAK